MREITGYICAVLIGVSLGLIGGGGSILTVPVLVYLFSISPVTATSYSLFIVGTTSLIGAYKNFKRNCIDFNAVLLLGIPSLIVTIIVRRLLIPYIPEQLFNIGSIQIKFSFLIMIVFSIIIIAASVSMIGNKTTEKQLLQTNKSKVIFHAIVLGFVTGILGAGGGFLIIPALVLFVGLPMKKAIGTSLLIIAINTIIGFVSDIAQYTINWQLLLIITALAIIGVLTGNYFEQKIKAEKLKKGFGWFVLTAGVFILIKEVFFM